MDQVTLLLAAAQDSAAHLAIGAATIPDPGSGEAPPGVGDKFEQIMGWVKWVCLGIVIVGIMIIGAMMAVGSRRGEGGEKAGALGWALGGAIVIAAPVALVGFLVG